MERYFKRRFIAVQGHRSVKNPIAIPYTPAIELDWVGSHCNAFRHVVHGDERILAQMNRIRKSFRIFSRYISVMHRARLGLRKNLSNHLPVNVGQAAVDSVMPHGELLVINAQQVKNCCMEIVTGRPSFHRFP